MYRSLRFQTDFQNRAKKQNHPSNITQNNLNSNSFKSKKLNLIIFFQPQYKIFNSTKHPIDSIPYSITPESKSHKQEQSNRKIIRTRNPAVSNQPNPKTIIRNDIPKQNA